MPSLYEDMLAAGLVQGNRYSDLYVHDTAEAREIIERHGKTGHRFTSNIDGAALIELPLLFDPYWNAKENNA